MQSSPRRRTPVDLTGKTSLQEIARLGAAAALAIGNDTGPTHLVAATQAPTVALFSANSDPALSAPRGRVTVLRSDERSGGPGGGSASCRGGAGPIGASRLEPEPSLDHIDLRVGRRFSWPRVTPV